MGLPLKALAMISTCKGLGYLRTAPNMIGFIKNAVIFYHTLIKKYKLKNED
jgi:hypothetical protein